MTTLLEAFASLQEEPRVLGDWCLDQGLPVPEVEFGGSNYGGGEYGSSGFGIGEGWGWGAGVGWGSSLGFGEGSGDGGASEEEL